jgi:hypothetical protein
MNITCPSCGVRLPLELMPAGSGASFPCSRCRSQLKVSPHDAIPILAMGVVLSFAICVAWGFRGQAFALITVGLAAVFYLIGRLVQSVIAPPRLQRTGSDKNLARQAVRSKPVYRAIRGGRVP